MVLEIPKSIHMCCSTLSKHIKVMRSMLFQNNHDRTIHYELECRFGTLRGDKFSPGIPEDVFRNIEVMLESYDKWEGTPVWQESHDYIYNHLGQRIRTSAFFENGKIEQRHMLKTTLSKTTMGFEPMDGAGCGGHPCDISVRCTISQEQAIKPKLIPDIVRPQFVRIKQRRSFRSECWAFELTRTWGGKTRQEAEQKQDSSPAIYEFEVECTDPLQYFQQEYHTDEYIATSILMKMRDLLPGVYENLPMHTVLDSKQY